MVNDALSCSRTARQGLLFYLFLYFLSLSYYALVQHDKTEYFTFLFSAFLLSA